MLHFFFFSVCKKSEHMTLKCLGYLFKHKKQLFHQKLKKNNKFFLKCHSHLQLFRIGNKGIFYHTWCESSKPLLSDQIVLMIERPQLWQKSRKTMNMHRTKNWQTVREQQKSDNHKYMLILNTYIKEIQKCLLLNLSLQGQFIILSINQDFSPNVFLLRVHIGLGETLSFQDFLIA